MLTVLDAIEQFLDACYANGLKKPTVRWYANKLKPFAAAFGMRALEDVQAADLRSYIRQLRDRDYRLVGGANQKQKAKGGLSVETLLGHYKTLERFYAWAEREYDRDPRDNPMQHIKKPRRPQPVPKAISTEDARKLLATCDDSQIGKRNRALIGFLLDTGCRINGALTLRADKLSLNRRRAFVYEKFDRAREVAYSDHTAKWLAEWIAVRPREIETVFCGLGTNSYGQPLTIAGVHKMLRELAKKAGVTGRFNPHSFRHSFARRYIEAGGDVSTLAKIMGHSNTAITTQVYAVFLADEALRRYEELNLMDKLLKGD